MWEETIGGTGHDWLEHAFQNSQGNYVFSGYSYSDVSEDKNTYSKGLSDMWIFETNLQGEIIWQKNFGGSWEDMIHKTLELPDATYLLAGTSYSNISGDKTENSRGDRDLWIVKLDANNEIEWQKTYGGTGPEDLNDIIVTSDGGFLVSSHSTSPVSGDKTMASYGKSDLWVLKLDGSGAIEWQNSYGGDEYDSYSRIMETADGNFFIAASSSSGVSGNKTSPSRGLGDYWIFEISPSGQIVWQKTIGGDNGDYLSDFENTPDGGYLLVGSSFSKISGEKTIASRGSDDVWLVKIDKVGNLEWQKVYGGNSTDIPEDISRSPDSGYWIGAISFSDVGSEKSEPHVGNGDHWMFKISDTGEMCWDKTIGGADRDQPNTGFTDLDDNYIMGGWSNSNASGDKSEDAIGDYDIWITKLEAPEIFAPEVNTPDPYIACDHDGDGFAEFDLSSLKKDIIGEQQNLILEYFTEDWKILPSPFPEKFTNTTINGQTINVRITREHMSCAVTEIQVLLVSEDCSSEEPDGPDSEEDRAGNFPDYFTPNGDGYNESWSPYSDFWDQLQYVQIYDRYGKLLVHLLSKQSWNGEFNDRLLPSDDYWYHALTNENKIITGHFSLIR